MCLYHKLLLNHVEKQNINQSVSIFIKHDYYQFIDILSTNLIYEYVIMHVLVCLSNHSPSLVHNPYVYTIPIDRVLSLPLCVLTQDIIIHMFVVLLIY